MAISEPIRFRVGLGFLNDITVDSELPYLRDSDVAETPIGSDTEEEDEEATAVKCVFGTVEGCKTMLRSSVPSSENKSH